MTNQKPTLSLEEFADLLGQLDRFIGAHNPELNLEVRAIGGFSLMYHDKQTSLVLLRKGSSDIDTLTHLPQSVATMVDIIATNNDVNSDWLNDCCYANHNFEEEFEPYITWEPTEYTFKHIDLKVANPKGILLMKLRAVCDALEFAGYPDNPEVLAAELRTQDVMDTVSLLRFLGIETVADLEAFPRPVEILGFDRFVRYAVDQGLVRER